VITRDPATFIAAATALEPDLPAACPRAVFLVSPEAFRVDEESAGDNAYMRLGPADPGRAVGQHLALHAALSDDVPALLFPGRADTPDAVFPNNVFATARVGGRGRVVVGHMRHAGRRREATRADLRGFFTGTLGYELHDLSLQPGICELTGSMVVDRARGVGFCGLSERCDETGAAAMAAAFGLRAMLLFDLAPGEYHANVVMSVLAGRALVLAPDGFADPAVARAIMALYADVIELSPAQKQAFAGNCIAVGGQRAWFSQRAADALEPTQRLGLQRAGFALGAVDLGEIEKAGGSLRCCVGEVY
jgi:hypothetical protein